MPYKGQIPSLTAQAINDHVYLRIFNYISSKEIYLSLYQNSRAIEKGQPTSTKNTLEFLSLTSANASVPVSAANQNVPIRMTTMESITTAGPEFFYRHKPEALKTRGAARGLEQARVPLVLQHSTSLKKKNCLFFLNVTGASTKENQRGCHAKGKIRIAD